MTGPRDGGRDPWHDPPVLSGLVLVIAAAFVVITRDHPDATLVGTLLAGASVLFGVKVAQIRNGGDKQ